MTKQVRLCHIVICAVQSQFLNLCALLPRLIWPVYYSDESGSAGGIATSETRGKLFSNNFAFHLRIFPTSEFRILTSKRPINPVFILHFIIFIHESLCPGIIPQSLIAAGCKKHRIFFILKCKQPDQGLIVLCQIHHADSHTDVEPGIIGEMEEAL